MTEEKLRKTNSSWTKSQDQMETTPLDNVRRRVLHQDIATMTNCYYTIVKEEALDSVDDVKSSSTLAHHTNVPFRSISPSIETTEIKRAKSLKAWMKDIKIV